MKYIICSIYDKATEAYMRPFVAQTEGQATRMFEDLANDPQSDISMHKEDYTLFHIGNFSDHDSEVENVEPKCLSRAHEVQQKVHIINKEAN